MAESEIVDDMLKASSELRALSQGIKHLQSLNQQGHYLRYIPIG